MRRSNKSHKVPNVKLRPAQPARKGAAQPTRDRLLAHARSDDAPSSTSVIDLCPRPFKGFLICATGISDKATLYKQAIELGAHSISDLTDQVTHLLAVEPGSAKYKCAVERKIPIMQPSWITTSYEIWLRGDDVDVEESIHAHRLPIFSSLVICQSGDAMPDERSRVAKLVQGEGGEYVKAIERPVRVTHLLCSGTEQTDKIRYAKKFNDRGEASIKLVWEEWFWDCVAFGGRFDEDKYSIDRPRPTRMQHSEPTTELPQLSTLDGAAPSNAGSKPQSNGDDADEEIASVRRVPAVTLQIWESLLGPRGFVLVDGALVRSPSKSQSQPRQLDWEPSPTRPKVDLKGKGRAADGDGGAVASVLGLPSFRRSASFAPKAPKEFKRMVSGIGRAQPTTLSGVRPGSSFLSAGAPGGLTIDGRPGMTVGAREASSPSSSSPAHAGVNGVRDMEVDNEAGASEREGRPSAGVKATATATPELFAGLRFRCLGEADCENVRAAVEGLAGCVIAEGETGEADYVVVRLVSGSQIYRQETDERRRPLYRTECWLERCIFEGRICAPDEHVTFTPLTIDTPVLGADLIKLSFSGLDQSEACWIRRLARALGVGHAPQFARRRTTHLLCPSGAGAKFAKANEWGVPVVGMAWLEYMARTGAVPPRGTLLIEIPPPPPQAVEKLASDRGTSSDQRQVVRSTPAPKDAAVSRPAQNQAAEQNAQPMRPRPRPVPRPASKPAARDQAQESTIASFGEPMLLQEPEQAASAVASTPPRAATPEPPSSAAEIRRELAEVRVASSVSPSPLKASRTGGGGSGGSASMLLPSSSSPLRIDDAATRALQENISVLLGKRANEGEAGEEGAGRPARRARAGKRARPTAKSRLVKVNSNSGSLFAELPMDAFTVAPEDDAMLANEALPDDSGMRVEYEDPLQKEEKMRLVKLMGGGDPTTDAGGDDGAQENQKPSGAPSKRKLVRRVTRQSRRGG
ncbi:hypothetical protein PUNSTDRAFT_93421 [Punctularia strigosozonata HHB-11173 SS5]|uniref:BRCT domain-containing protein n=1 Tax=Punctularia strigosozonata (strain HHB-11173) TaxID=741275 RepID=R7S178_PUNST|nr:uncharacterized protein PUNSTDRAFT_93421 [Punctularia strigosozonata HHB-11173 SS5]EIN03978.1 hypothetical protein PUNSTDRAFT_93421 [Punctularia strigosozonata HHB-11173 SS5]